MALAVARCSAPAIAVPESGARAGSPPPGGRLVAGVRGDVSSFNIYTATNAFSQEIDDLLFLKLADEQDDFGQGPPSFRASLASSWETSADRRRIVFHLDPRARWSDGTPVTSADVLFSHRVAVSPEVGWAGADVKDRIESVTAPDARTVVYTFKQPYPYALMDAVEGNVLPAPKYEPIPLAEWPKRAFREAPVVSGPFRLKRYEPGSIIELERNPAWARSPLPGLDAVVFKILPDESALLNELLSGGVDFMENVSEDAARKIETVPRLRVARAPDLSYGFICWNTARPLFADARVRRALTMAIDRNAILEGLLPRTGRPSLGPILSFMWAFDREARPIPHDLARARDLLREAGWSDADGDGVLDRGGVPFRFELETNQGSKLRSDVVEMVASQLRKAGIEAIPRTLEFAAFVARHQKHDFDAFVSSWRESTKVDLRSVLHSSAKDGGYNYGSYANPELDALIDKAREESDPSAARDLWRRAQRIVAQDQPFTFLFERDRLHAVPMRLEGMRSSPRSAYAGLEEWRLEPAGASSP